MVTESLQLERCLPTLAAFLGLQRILNTLLRLSIQVHGVAGNVITCHVHAILGRRDAPIR